MHDVKKIQLGLVRVLMDYLCFAPEDRERSMKYQIS